MSYYKIPKKYKGKDRTRIHQIIKSGMDKNLSTTEIQNNLKKEGLSYRRKNLLFDIRLKKSSYNIGVTNEGKVTYNPVSNSKARTRKQKWFIDVFEKFRIENGLTTKQARKIIKQEIKTSHKNNSERILGKKFYDVYKDVFNKTPTA